MKVIKAPLLWLWIGPLPISWLVIGRLHGNGRSGFWMDMIAAATCSLFFGGLLAYKIFPTFKKRLFGSFIFSTGTLYLLSCLLFTGCFLPIPSTPPNPAKEEKMRQRYEARIKEWTVQHVVPRDASADSTMIDLTQYYDLLLPGQNGEDTSSQRFPRPGTHISNGIKFDVRGEIRLQWQRKVSGIPVNRKCSEIDFLHGADWGVSNQTTSSFIIHFSNGQSEIVANVFARDLHFSDIGFGSHRGAAATFTNFVVWTERLDKNSIPTPAYGFYIKKWSNPFPDEIVDTIDFAALENQSAPFLVAITVQGADAKTK
ncbi:MAG TPA: hypothetical protein VN625_00790 [Desulfuromonadaceae bacterium]|nr:hypothetical protein [Desulfuromonadaceae bacterium]